MQQRNKFEMNAHNESVRKRYPRPSWEHTIDTYQGNRKSFDWVTPASILAIIGFIIVLFIKL